MNHISEYGDWRALERPEQTQQQSRNVEEEGENDWTENGDERPYHWRSGL